MRQLPLIALLVALGLAIASPDAISHVTVRIRSQEDLDAVARLRLSVEERKNDILVIRVSASDRAALRAAGIPFNEHVPRPAAEVQRIIRASHERGPPGSEYHNYEQLTELLHQTATAHPAIVRVFSIGKSHQGRDLWAMRITDHPDTQEREPEVKYIGNIHGDETLGRENLIRFIHLLTSQYGIDQRITRLVDSTDIYIIPSMNPDGFEAGQRYNQPPTGAGIDLNRDFPDQYDAPGTTYRHQPETLAIMEFCSAHYFVLSISFHGGDLVVNYPWDGNREHRSTVYAASPDDEVFRAISLVYSTHHPTMHASAEFANGITNGAKWYVLYGGMQDWNYITRGTFEVTVELAYEKTPPSKDLQGYYEANEESMLSFLEIVHSGVRGVVRQAGKPVGASITVDGIAHTMYADPAMGDFYRPLTEGTYVLRARVGNVEKTRTVYVPRMQPFVYTEVTFSFD